MSNYKIKISKRSVVEKQDSTHWIGTKESFEDSTAKTRAQQDIDVAVYFDDSLKHTVTLTDAGATLEFDTDASVGEHTIKVVPAKSPIHQTDVCVDKIYINDTVVVMTQYDFNNRIYGTASTARQLLADPQKEPHQYVWWGNMVTNNPEYDLDGPFYRPSIVSDHQGEWHWTFNKTSEGLIWASFPGDVDDIMYDSTAQHTYYAGTPQQVFPDSDGNVVHDPFDDTQHTTGEMYQNYFSGWGEDELDSSSSPWVGPGTYDANLTYVDSSWDDSLESSDRIVILQSGDYLNCKFNRWYHQKYSITAITIT